MHFGARRFIATWLQQAAANPILKRSYRQLGFPTALVSSRFSQAADSPRAASFRRTCPAESAAAIMVPTLLFLGGIMPYSAAIGRLTPGAFFYSRSKCSKVKKARENDTCSGLVSSVFEVLTPRGTLSLRAESLAFERAGRQQSTRTQACWRAAEINAAKRASAG